jgi:hypothetical protein
MQPGSPQNLYLPPVSHLTTVWLRKMLLQIHGIMQHAPDFHDARVGCAVKQEVPGLANSVSWRSSSFTAMKEMIRSAILGDVRPLNAAGTVRIGRKILKRGFD